MPLGVLQAAVLMLSPASTAVLILVAVWERLSLGAPAGPATAGH